MTRMLLVALGGGLGSMSRYAIALATHRIIDKTFPFGTLIANACGSLLIGVAFALLLDHLGALGDHLRVFIIVGFLGGFTTFSAFSLDTLLLLENGELFSAVVNVVVSVGLCLLLTYLGMTLTRNLV